MDEMDLASWDAMLNFSSGWCTKGYFPSEVCERCAGEWSTYSWTLYTLATAHQEDIQKDFKMPNSGDSDEELF